MQLTSDIPRQTYDQISTQIQKALKAIKFTCIKIESNINSDIAILVASPTRWIAVYY